jgi:hypothetical protein
MICCRMYRKSDRIAVRLCAVFVGLTVFLGSSAQAAQTITIRSTDTGSKYEGWAP